MKLEFVPDDLRRGLAIAKLVKPLTNDFVLKVMGGNLVIYSYDKRRSARAEIRPINSIPIDYQSEEHFLPSERQSFLDSELTSITLTVTEKEMKVKTDDGKQSRQATIKRKAELSRRPPIPIRPSLEGTTTFPSARDFEELLRQVSCSALIRETKTEDEMRVNQVHFYPEQSCAVANARFYATMATMPGMNIDLSVVSADVPLMKAFCSKLSDKSIQIGQDQTRLFLIDPSTNSYLIFTRVASKKPPLSLIPEDGHQIIVAIDRDQLAKALGWAALAIEGTQRLTLVANAEPDGKGVMEFLNGKQQISQIPVEFKLGKRLAADFPVKYLSGIVRYLGEGNACLKYSHPAAPTVLEIAEQTPEGEVRARHFIQAMKEHN